MRPALTLIEVLASLALLGGLMVSVLMAQGKLKRQHHMATQKMQAVRAADQLLEHWLNSKEGMPRQDQGVLESNSAHFHWQTSTVPLEGFASLELEKTILQIFIPPSPELSRVQISICEVEVVRRVEPAQLTHTGDEP